MSASIKVGGSGYITFARGVWGHVSPENFEI